jgi:hypothetical protein
MMRKIVQIGLIAGLVLGMAAGSLAADKKKIVVGDFFTKGGGEQSCRGWPSNYGETAAASMRSRLAETGAFTVVSRDQMKKILKEHEMAMTGLSDPTNAKMLGQFLQADLVMGGDFLCHPTSFEFNVNLVSVETAEIVWSKVYEMKDVEKMSRVLKDMSKLMADYAKTGSMGKSAGKSEDLAMLDSKALHDASRAIIGIIQNSVPKVTARIEDVNAYAEEGGGLKVKLSSGGNNVWPGFKLQVKRGDEEVGWLFLKKKGTGTVEAGTDGEISSFEQGDKATSEDFKPKVAIGFIEDEDESNDKMIDMFKEGLLKEMSEADRLQPAEESDVGKIIDKMGQKTSKKDLEKLFKKGVDLLITGRFSGANGNRRIDFEALGTYDGKRVVKINYDSRL